MKLARKRWHDRYPLSHYSLIVSKSTFHWTVNRSANCKSNWSRTPNRSYLRMKFLASETSTFLFLLIRRIKCFVKGKFSQPYYYLKNLCRVIFVKFMISLLILNYAILLLREENNINETRYDRRAIRDKQAMAFNYYSTYDFTYIVTYILKLKYNGMSYLWYYNTSIPLLSCKWSADSATWMPVRN